jgi:hypothetical protein
MDNTFKGGKRHIESNDCQPCTRRVVTDLDIGSTPTQVMAQHTTANVEGKTIHYLQVWDANAAGPPALDAEALRATVSTVADTKK